MESRDKLPVAGDQPHAPPFSTCPMRTVYPNWTGLSEIQAAPVELPVTSHWSRLGGSFWRAYAIASQVRIDRFSNDTYFDLQPLRTASLMSQVFASIQTMVLLKDPYYNEGEVHRLWSDV